MTIKDALDFAFVVFLIYLAVYSVVNRICKAYEMKAGADTMAKMSEKCDPATIEQMMTTFTVKK